MIDTTLISVKTEICRVDIDDEEGLLHHIKVSNAKDFGLWLEQLKQHRLFQQHQVFKHGCFRLKVHFLPICCVNQSYCNKRIQSHCLQN